MSSNDEIRDNIYELIDKHDGCGAIDECEDDISEYLASTDNVFQYKVWKDTDVFDSCGLDIFYISAAWIDKNGELQICGARLTSQ